MRWSWWRVVFFGLLVVAFFVLILSDFDTYKPRHGRPVKGPLAVEINTVLLIAGTVFIAAGIWIAKLRGDRISGRKDWRDFE